MKNLQRLGRVLHVSSSRNIIVKAEKKLPRIGDQVVDENITPIGEVFDIIGPVSSPYISVKPKIKKAENYIGQVLYFSATSRPRFRGKKNE